MGLFAQGLATASERNRGSQSLRTSAQALGVLCCVLPCQSQFTTSRIVRGPLQGAEADLVVSPLVLAFPLAAGRPGVVALT